MTNVIPLPTTDAGKRALAQARAHRKSALIWLMSCLHAGASDYTRRQALAVLSTVRGKAELTTDAAKWLAIMTASFDPRASEGATLIRDEILARKGL